TALQDRLTRRASCRASRLRTNGTGRRRTMKVATLVKIGIGAVVALAIGVGAYAFTASNTVPSTNVGAGSGTVSGYTVTNLHYTLNATTPTNIDSLTFTVSPAIPSTASGT